MRKKLGSVKTWGIPLLLIILGASLGAGGAWLYAITTNGTWDNNVFMESYINATTQLRTPQILLGGLDITTLFGSGNLTAIGSWITGNNSATRGVAGGWIAGNRTSTLSTAGGWDNSNKTAIKNTVGSWVANNATATLGSADTRILGNTSQTLTTVGGWIAGNTTTFNGSLTNLGYTAYIGRNASLSGIHNYFYCDGTADQVQIQAAIDYCAAIEDSYKIFVDLGVYNCAANVTFKGGDRCGFYGIGMPKTYSSALTTGGSVLHFSNDASLDVGASAAVYLQDLGFYFSGTYTHSLVNLMDNTGNGCDADSIRCMYVVNCDVPDGNGGNPASTLTGNCINVGKVSGPPAHNYEWRQNVFYDERSNSISNCLLAFCVEHMIFEGNSIYPNFDYTSMTTANFMFVNPVSSAKLSYNIWYLTDAFKTHSGAGGAIYHAQYMSSGANKNLEVDHEQFLNSTNCSYNFYTNSGNTYVYGSFPQKVEGGTTAVDLSVGGSGTVHIDISNRGYEETGTSTLSNGQTIKWFAHNLVGVPTHVEVGWQSDLGGKSWYWTANATAITIHLSAAAGGNYDFSWYAKYNKNG